VGIPENVNPVDGFDVNRYLGTWYEIVRLDHSFEKGLEKVTAHYSLREDGGVRVINRGYDPRKKEWKEAQGRAYFVDSPTAGRLKVSFFGPFYGSYNIIALDKERYEYALVCGPNTSYLWILSRTPEMERGLLNLLIDKAKRWGFKTEDLIFVTH
jgi:apolipoprotein D and lipocalin family protein